LSAQRAVTQALAVVNAVASSLGFSLFAPAAGTLDLAVRGQDAGLYTAPRFVAYDRACRRGKMCR
jgi:hypothetical protein